MRHTTASGPEVFSLLNIGFGPKDDCKAEVGIALLKGREYGAPVGRISPPRTEPVSLSVDDHLIPTPAPNLIKYDNGLEVVFLADGSVFQALISGTTATDKL